MSWKFLYYGQNDGQQQPDVALVGDPGTDIGTLKAAGYLGGTIMALKTSATAGRGTVAVPCDGATLHPYGILVGSAGENSGSIGPSGSGKVTIVRALPQGFVDSEAYVTTDTFTVGAPLYCGQGANAGKFTATAPTTGYTAPVATCFAIPSGSYPTLGVTSLL